MPSLVIAPGIVGDEGRHKTCYQGAETQVGELKDTHVKITKNELRVCRAKQFQQVVVQNFRENHSGWISSHGGFVEEVCWLSWTEQCQGGE